MPGLFADLYRSSLCHMVQKLQAFMSVANLGTHTLSSIISKITSSISISISLFNYLLSGEPILLKIRFGDMIVMNIEIVMGLFFWVITGTWYVSNAWGASGFLCEF